MKNKGKLIVAFGVPGSGKSSVFDALGQQIDAQIFHEPEEESWGKAVKERNLSGNFTAIMWFRSARVPQLYEAVRIKENGGVALADSYYDKLFYLYMNMDGLQWLFEASDPYYEEMRMVAKKDHDILPKADCLVFFRVDRETWRKFLASRHRELDQDPVFLQNCFNAQEPFLKIAKQYCHETGTRFVVFDQFYDSPENAAVLLRQTLEAQNII